MEDLKLIISKNIVMLRRREGMTQADLARCLNYSDKAVSKWERGESVPDIAVIKAIADMFGVTVDYLISDGHSISDADDDVESEELARKQKKQRMHSVITGMSVLLVWVVAAVLFVILDSALSRPEANYLILAYTVVASVIVWLVFNSIWHNRRRNYLIISLLMWSVLLAIHTSVLIGGYNLWQMYILGFPGQFIIVLWSKIGKRK